MKEKLKLLKNKTAFNIWKKEEYISPEDCISVPDKFPCFVYLTVHSWAYEEWQAVYIYPEEMNQFIKDMKGEKE